MRARAEVLRDVGACLSPMNAWLLLQGLETLPLRMRAHVENARAVAAFLRGREEVAWINYAELEDSPYRALAARYLRRARARSSPSACAAGARRDGPSSKRSNCGAISPTSAMPRVW